MISENLSRHIPCLLLRPTVILLTAATIQAQSGATVSKRPVTVDDSIRMIRPLDSGYQVGSQKGRVAKFSPDGKRFLIVLQKGNPENNTNEFSILLFQTSEMLHVAKPKVLLTMSSSSNREAIRQLKWLYDNETVIFLGENPGELPQVYSLNIRTKSRKKLTNHATPIVRYDISNKGGVVIFEADPPITKTVHTAETLRKGLVASSDRILDILADDHYPQFGTEGEYLFLVIEGHSERRIPVDDFIDSEMPIALSPDGRYATIGVFVRSFPRFWENYRDKGVGGIASEPRPKGAWRNLLRYLLLDTKSTRLEPLLDTPRQFRPGVTWAPDGNSVVISAARLPLDVENPGEREERKKDVYVLEVRVPSKEILKLRHDSDNLTFFQVTWRNPTRVYLERMFGHPDTPVPTAYEKHDSAWKEVPVSADDTRVNVPVDVLLQEDMSTPPKIYVSERADKQRTLLLDLNPQFAGLSFGKVERVVWYGTDGHEFWGGLFWPPDYVPGKQYPLVIQTHGFNPDAFSMDGIPYPPAAARVLAGQGFMVLQVNGVNKVYKDVEGLEEGPVQMAAYEGAVEWLAGRGLIDKNLVGLQGFSRTVYYVAYTLTHSKNHFSAAIMADGINGGYLPYLAFPQAGPTYEGVNGGLPWGKTADSWLRNSPGFNLDKVYAPVRLETHGAFGPLMILSEWEWFIGLTRLGKPADLIYLPDGPHVLVKPWERMVSQQGAVDWFRFWLKDEQDPDPAKDEQYKRWRELRELQEENQKKPEATEMSK